MDHSRACTRANEPAEIREMEDRATAMFRRSEAVREAAHEADIASYPEPSALAESLREESYRLFEQAKQLETAAINRRLLYLETGQ